MLPALLSWAHTQTPATRQSKKEYWSILISRLLCSLPPVKIDLPSDACKISLVRAPGSKRQGRRATKRTVPQGRPKVAQEVSPGLGVTTEVSAVGAALGCQSVHQCEEKVAPVVHSCTSYRKSRFPGTATINAQSAGSNSHLQTRTQSEGGDLEAAERSNMAPPPSEQIAGTQHQVAARNIENRAMKFAKW